MKNNKITYAIWRFLCVLKDKYIMPTVHKYRLLDYPFIYTQAFFRSQRIVWYNIISLDDVIHMGSGTKRVVEPETKRKVCLPEYFGQTKQQVEEFDSPAISVYRLKCINVIGGTNFVVAGKCVASDILASDVDDRIDMHFGLVRRKEKKRVAVITEKTSEQIEEAVSLLGFAASNYYHFTIEILSRLAYVDGIPEYKGIPLLVDEEIKKYSQLTDALGCFRGGRPIRYIRRGQFVKIDKLVVPSMNTWMPINVRLKTLFRLADNMIAESAVRNIRNSTNKYIYAQGDRKLFLSRKNTRNSRLNNASEVEKLFADKGFEIVYTEGMSYEEQVRIFSSAKCIAGVTGAALTNVVYCNRNTVVGCIIPKEYNFCIYSTLAHLTGCKPVFLDAEIKVKTQYVSQDVYEVDLNMCSDYADRLIELADIKEND